MFAITICGCNPHVQITEYSNIRIGSYSIEKSPRSTYLNYLLSKKRLDLDKFTETVDYKVYTSNTFGIPLDSMRDFSMENFQDLTMDQWNLMFDKITNEQSDSVYIETLKEVITKDSSTLYVNTRIIRLIHDNGKWKIYNIEK